MRAVGHKGDRIPGADQVGVPSSSRVSSPSITSRSSRVPVGCPSELYPSPATIRTSHSSTCCEVPDPTISRAALPLCPPVQSATPSSARTTRALGTSGASTSVAMETPSAVASRQIVATLGFVRACSTCSSIPLLTPALAARSSRVQAILVRCPRTLRPTAALTSSGSGTVRSTHPYQ